MIVDIPTMRGMKWLKAAAFGALGGLSLEVPGIVAAFRWHGVPPWKVTPAPDRPSIRRPDLRPGELPAPGPLPYTMAVGFSTLLSATLAGVLAASYGPAAVPIASYTVGLAAFGIVRKLADSAPPIVATAVIRSLKAGLATR
ncbi:hypothetical protein GCM10018790_11490 [Kitasatospora xanthocidica]|uniref:hypothetical protein n=1 Tax=Kitasatospora xanthocidica TaxID=83382 RepID=UPI0016775575|nr:hypothetical protein [Kitasatospora xanthocidica]GHF35404.1 hypothetical protein GCM10018790_11490 [Kitasatospora xanthocidica]